MIPKLDDFAGRLIVTWPSPIVAQLAELCTLVDAADGEQITSCTRMVVDSHCGNWITATLTLPTTEDGTPILRGIVNAAWDGDTLRTSEFRWLVAEMRVAA